MIRLTFPQMADEMEAFALDDAARRPRLYVRASWELTDDDLSRLAEILRHRHARMVARRAIQTKEKSR